MITSTINIAQSQARCSARGRPCLVAIAAFLAGAFVAGRNGKALAGGSLRRWLLTSATIEAALLWVAAGFAVGLDIAAGTPQPNVMAIIGLTPLAMGYRNGTIRQLKVRTSPRPSSP
jgi:hypothetical protein